MNTPTPWYVEPGDPFVIRGEAGTRVARVLTPDTEERGNDFDEARANRAMLLAAPDLLKACKALIETADQGNRPIATAIAVARAAIAKAEAQP